jgi:hypothetical protein
MSYVAIAAAVVGAGATAYGAYSKNKANKAATAAGAFGTKVQPAPYQPIDFNAEQMKAILGNAGALPEIAGLTRGANDIVAQGDIRRAKKLIPGYKQMMSLEGGAATDLLSGRLPYDDVLGIAADRSGLTGALGTPGTAGPATLRDLGLSRLDAIGKGGGILKDMVNIAGQISPISRYSKPSDSFIDPLERIKLKIAENQTIQQSEQSANFLNARGDPAAQAQLAMSLTGGGDQGYVDAASSLLAALGKQYGANAGGLNTAGAGAPGAYGSTYSGSMGGLPVYRPARANSIPA